MGEALDLIIAVDFDNTLIKPGHKFGWDSHYELIDGAREALERLSIAGCRIVLNSARYGWYRIPMCIFIHREKLPIEYSILNKKPMADIYVDDSNLYAEGAIDWGQILSYIEKNGNRLKRLP